jgi:hypothetical protein
MVEVQAMHMVSARLQVVHLVLQLVRVQLHQMLVAQEKKMVHVVLQVTGAVAVVVVLEQLERQQSAQAVTAVQVVLLQLQAPVLLMVAVVAAAVATQAAQVVLQLQEELVVQVEAETAEPPRGMRRHRCVPQVEAVTEPPIPVVVVVGVAIAITTTQEIRKVVAVTAAPESLSFAMHCPMYQPQTLTLQTTQELHQLTTSLRQQR